MNTIRAIDTYIKSLYRLEKCQTNKIKSVQKLEEESNSVVTNKRLVSDNYLLLVNSLPYFLQVQQLYQPHNPLDSVKGSSPDVNPLIYGCSRSYQKFVNNKKYPTILRKILSYFGMRTLKIKDSQVQKVNNSKGSIVHTTINQQVI